LGIRHVANDPIPEKFTVTKPWKKPTPTQGCSASIGEEEEEALTYRCHEHFNKINIYNLCVYLFSP
jgi:hypothetical protein